MTTRATLTSMMWVVILPGITPAAAQSPREVAACDSGNLAACNSIGIAHGEAGRYTEAARYFRRVCEGGEMVGCSNLAEQYYDGTGVTRDLQQALSLFLEACEVGVTSGCAGVCIVSRSGNDLTQDEVAQCRSLVTRACEEGNPWMCAHRQPAAPGNALDNGCRSGAEVIANAYIRWNPFNAIFYGDIGPYVRTNRDRFVAGADAIRCADALSTALLARSIESYDPTVYQQRQELDARLGSMGLEPGQHASTPSEMLHSTARLLSWLSQVLPSATQGDFAPMQDPYHVLNQNDEIIQMQLFARQMLSMFLQDPSMIAGLRSIESDIRAAATAEYRMLVRTAQAIAN